DRVRNGCVRAEPRLRLTRRHPNLPSTTLNSLRASLQHPCKQRRFSKTQEAQHDRRTHPTNDHEPKSNNHDTDPPQTIQKPTRTTSRTRSTATCAPKGQPKVAQGNALGILL